MLLRSSSWWGLGFIYGLSPSRFYVVRVVRFQGLGSAAKPTIVWVKFMFNAPFGVRPCNSTVGFFVVTLKPKPKP